MAFAIGDKVIHRYHGPGRITRMDHVESRSGTHECYVVDVGHRLVVWVPIDGVSEQSLRPPLTAAEISGLAEILRSPAQPLNLVNREREQEIKNRLKDGSPEALCSLMRDLTAYAAHRVPSANDAAVLEKLRATLLAEWQLATDAEDAAVEVDALLRESISKGDGGYGQGREAAG